MLATLLLTTTGAWLAAPARAATTLVVDDDGKGSALNCNARTSTYADVGEALAAAVSGDVVKVCPGSYLGNVTVGAGVTLLGPKAAVSAARRSAGAGDAYLLARAANAPVVLLSGDDAEVSGFVIRGATNDAGVRTSSANLTMTINNNIISGNTIGLSLNSQLFGPVTVTVQGNRFSSNNVDGSAAGNGIYSDQTLREAQIQGNTFEGHLNAGILIAGLNLGIGNVAIAENSFTNNASDVNTGGVNGLVVRNNKFTPGRFSTGSQIRVNYVTGSFIYGNDLQRSGFAAIAIRDDGFGATSSLEVYDNVITSPAAFGIDVTSAGTGIDIDDNVVRSSKGQGIHLGATTAGIDLTGNTVTRSATFACTDESSGGGTLGTANNWVDNAGRPSTPVGICV